MDAYLQFCKRALVEENSDKTLAEFFPLADNTAYPTTAAPQKKTRILPLAGPRIPAGQVRIYHTLDVLGAVPAQFAAVLEAGSRFCGVAIDEVASIVERYERRLVRRAERDRRDG